MAGDMSDDDVVGFILRWNLNDDAQAKLMSLSPAVRERVVQDFQAPEGMPEVNGRLIKFANIVDKSFAANAAKHGSREDEINDFSMRWNLNDDAQAKLRKLSPHVQSIVMSSFNPKAPQEQVNGKFIMFASSVEKTQGHSGAHNFVEQDPIEAFVRHWNLNEDAQNKLSKLPPHVQEIVVNSFNPKGAHGEVNGKFIMFASSVEKAQAPAVVEQDPVEAFVRHWNLNEDAQIKLSKLSPHVQDIVMSSFDPKAPQDQVNGKFIMFASSVEKAQGNSGAQRIVEQDPVEAFISHWNLNEDAVAKLTSLAPHVQEIVINSFDPPPHLPEVNGKLIMFATSVEKVQGQGQQDFVASQQSIPVAKGYGVAQKGAGKTMPKGSWGAWAPIEQPSYEPWGPGAGQKRSWSQSQIQGWSPPAKQAAAAPIHNAQFDHGLPEAIDEYAQIGFASMWDLNDDAIAKVKSLAPPVRFKVLNEFKPAGTPQEGKGWSGKLISFASQLEKYSK